MKISAPLSPRSTRSSIFLTRLSASLKLDDFSLHTTSQVPDSYSIPVNVIRAEPKPCPLASPGRCKATRILLERYFLRGGSAGLVSSFRTLMSRRRRSWTSTISGGPCASSSSSDWSSC